MPKVIVDDYGGKRTDPGMLGHGIYFASSARCVSVQNFTDQACILGEFFFLIGN